MTSDRTRTFHTAIIFGPCDPVQDLGNEPEFGCHDLSQIV